MPDTFTFILFGYGVILGGLMIYVISLGIRQYLLHQKKENLEQELNQPPKTKNPK